MAMFRFSEKYVFKKMEYGKSKVWAVDTIALIFSTK